MDVIISELPIDIQEQIPLSIRITDTHQLEDLPNDVQYLILTYLERPSVPYDYDVAYDAVPELSLYNDLKIITNKKDLMGEYLKNYFLIPVTSYPWDVTFGCRLKTYLSTRDTALRETLISSEVDNIVGAIGNDYDIDVKVNSIQVLPIKAGLTDYNDYTYYKITIELEIEDEVVTVTMNPN